MPTVTCPGCEKKYNLPATAVGQVANCKCGKKFRVGGGAAESQPQPQPASAGAKSPATSQPAIRAAAKPVAAVSSSPSANVAVQPSRVEKPKNNDNFWDDVDKPLPKIEEPPVTRATPAFKHREAPSPGPEPKENLLVAMWHSRARKLLMGPPLVVVGVLILVANISSGERIPRGVFYLIGVGVAISIAGLTGD
jgi:hypothetical protein